jgi:hypothetical protein
VSVRPLPTSIVSPRPATFTVTPENSPTQLGTYATTLPPFATVLLRPHPCRRNSLPPLLWRRQAMARAWRYPRHRCPRAASSSCDCGMPPWNPRLSSSSPASRTPCCSRPTSGGPSSIAADFPGQERVQISSDVDSAPSSTVTATDTPTRREHRPAARRRAADRRSALEASDCSWNPSPANSERLWSGVFTLPAAGARRHLRLRRSFNGPTATILGWTSSPLTVPVTAANVGR